MTDDRPTEAIGITAADYNGWRQHPVTKAFRRYLRDYVTALEQHHTMRWRDGNSDPRFEDWSSGQAQGISEIAEIEFEDIAAFYRPEEEEENDEHDASSEDSEY